MPSPFHPVLAANYQVHGREHGQGGVEYLQCVGVWDSLLPNGAGAKLGARPHGLTPGGRHQCRDEQSDQNHHGTWKLHGDKICGPVLSPQRLR